MSEELVVHVVCHTHDDPGWLKTFQGYYDEDVKNILDSMVVSLSANKERKFSYVEMSFFKKWYDSQSDEIKGKVKEFISEGRLEIINGGWVMHDEASSYYKHLIDNMRLGLKFLKEEFNITPKIGWFIDPFGHSSATSHILSQMNFEQIVLTRIDYLERRYRIENHNLEFIYDPFGLGQNIFTHISYRHYNPRNKLNDYIRDKTITLSEDELKSICEDTYKTLLQESDAYRTKNVLLYYGDDFTFRKPNFNYENIEMVMNYVNKNMKGTMKMIYSTPSQYFKSVLESGAEFEKHSNYDFFPYGDGPHCYWTGYFATRANMKGLIKQLGLYLNITNRLLFEIYIGHKDIMDENKDLINEAIEGVYFARENLGILQHHDAITGTSLEKTHEDYENMANDGITKMKENINKLVNILGYKMPSELSCGFEETINIKNENDNNFIIINPHLKGEYFCNYRINTFDEDDNNSYTFSVTDGENNIFGNNIAFNDSEIGLKYSSIQFIKPFEKSNFISPIAILRTNKVIKKNYFSDIPQNTTLTIGYTDLTFDTTRLKFKKDNTEFALSHGFYTSYNNNSNVRPENSNPDGAYIFSPCENELQRFGINKSKSFYQETFHFTTIVLRYPYSYLIIIIEHSNLNIYTESVFDPIPNEYDTAYNYLFVLDSNINNINEEYNQPQIFTDSQGINMMQRIKDTRPNYKYELTEKVTSNFYPITSVASLYETDNKKNKISIYSDRAQSAGFMDKGQIQLICHRFSTGQDWKGMSERLYEKSSMTRFFSVKHFISFEDKNYSDYFNKVPIILNSENEDIVNVSSNYEKVISADDFVDIEFEVKKYGEIFAQVGNVFCDYFGDSGKDNENIKFKFDSGKIVEYNLNGVEELKEVENEEEINIKKQSFKSFLINNI